MKQSESNLQRVCVKWFRLQFKELDRNLFAIPNGGKRDRISAAIMKGEGVTAGVADLFLMVPNEEFHGLWIEMKLPKGRQSPTQKEFEEIAIKHGYDYKIARSLEDFQFIIFQYL